MMTKYYLLHEEPGEVVYDTFSLKELCEHLVGLDKGVIYTTDGKYVAAFTESSIRINRELDTIPDKLIRSLF